MKKNFLPYILLIASWFCADSCKKSIAPLATEICLHNSSVNYLKRWAAVLIQTDVYNTSGSLQSRTIVYPHGYFQLNSDFTYNLFSDDAPVNGKWGINDSCQFVLNAHTATERRFSVITLTPDSLTIKQTIGRTTIIQHYAAFTCPALTNIAYRWDNAFTVEAHYADGIVPRYIYPVGYFRLNPDASYNVLSNNVPLNGTWGISQPGCLLVLDKNRFNERAFDVQKLTSDSLVIWRKDTIAKMNYLQYYSRHK